MMCVRCSLRQRKIRKTKKPWPQVDRERKFEQRATRYDSEEMESAYIVTLYEGKWTEEQEEKGEIGRAKMLGREGWVGGLS